MLYNSHQSDSVPFEGVISEGTTLRIDFASEDPSAIPTFNIRFEGDSLPTCGSDVDGNAAGSPFAVLLITID